jgi:hypothetical protein
MGRYMESYLPGIEEHRVVLERGAEIVGESLRQRRHRLNGNGRGGKDGPDSMPSSLAHGAEVGWMIWSRFAPPVVALYVWWVVFAVWRKLDDGQGDFLTQFTTNMDKVETWLMWASAGLVVLLCTLVLVIWAVVEGIRVFSGSKLDPPSREGEAPT